MKYLSMLPISLFFLDSGRSVLKPTAKADHGQKGLGSGRSLRAGRFGTGAAESGIFVEVRKYVRPVIPSTKEGASDSWAQLICWE